MEVWHELEVGASFFPPTMILEFLILAICSFSKFSFFPVFSFPLVFIFLDVTVIPIVKVINGLPYEGIKKNKVLRFPEFVFVRY